jgi:hypothetical protein
MVNLRRPVFYPAGVWQPSLEFTAILKYTESESEMPVDPKHTAVVLIEYQNDFTSELGAVPAAAG